MAIMVIGLLSGCNPADILAPKPQDMEYFTACYNPTSYDYQIAIVAAGTKLEDVPDSAWKRFDHGGGSWEYYLHQRDYRIYVRKIFAPYALVVDETHSPDAVQGNAHYNGITSDSAFILGQGWQP